MTLKEFDKKWGEVNTDYLDKKQFAEFKADCFDMYETEGFADTFQSPYDEVKENNGMKFEVIRRAELSTEVDLECMPMWFIRLENGKEILCYPEEICKAENIHA